MTTAGIWTFSRDSWLIRFYLYWYAWGVDEQVALKRLTFCRLFWAVVLSPLVVPLATLAYAAVFVASYAIDFAGKWDDKSDAKAKKHPPKIKTSDLQPWPIRAADAVGAFFDRIVAFFHAHPNIGKSFKFASLGGSGGVALAGAAFGIYSAATHWHGFLTGLAFAGVFICLALSVLAVASTAAYFFGRSKPGKSVVNALVRLFGRVGRGLKHAAQFFVAGHHAVKSRTCPLIVVKD